MCVFTFSTPSLWLLHLIILVGMNDDNSKPHSSRQTDALSKGSRVNLVIAKSTVVLWGRRVMQVALSSSSAIALTDLGELFVWGGHKKWWEGNDPKSFSPVKSLGWIYNLLNHRFPPLTCCC